ncbi:MAG: DUF4404 family protein [Chthoniobacteraceae bacterium]
MIIRRIEQIEARIKAASNLTEETRAGLLRDLSALKAEAESVPKTAGADVPAEPVPLEDGPIGPLVDELSGSIDSLETSHPRMTEMANRIAMVLANMGI